MLQRFLGLKRKRESVNSSDPSKRHRDDSQATTPEPSAAASEQGDGHISDSLHEELYGLFPLTSADVESSVKGPPLFE
jgi:hypothetical protein